MIELLSLTSLAIRKGRLTLPITSYLIRNFKISDRLPPSVEERSLILSFINFYYKFILVNH
ncbi:MAG: hypothetical protein O4861_02700 [Trichodesmium sp. St16_bin4-tuft]|nr:hypothetical protein [Trichodesmium sp. MAG_R01]MDE5073503.1 hypothetical protein [Trichodesmium sp. St5_bin8]MDE5090667.1 hypothetical protein [Trichodesmium sp. St18_bin3_1_1]MDE5097300.1 hypothetical protein [Trichodesmium sp. St16_bin4-tuft]MDE5102779.1 hypothetical protein [Trichodesmium sp. St19_bin2]